MDIGINLNYLEDRIYVWDSDLYVWDLKGLYDLAVSESEEIEFELLDSRYQIHILAVRTYYLFFCNLNLIVVFRHLQTHLERPQSLLSFNLAMFRSRTILLALPLPPHLWIQLVQVIAGASLLLSLLAPVRISSLLHLALTRRCFV